MTEIPAISVGIIEEHKAVQHTNEESLEKILCVQKYFKVLKLRQRKVKNSAKLKFLIEEWSEYENVDLIFIIGNIEFTFESHTKMNQSIFNPKEFPSVHKLLFQEKIFKHSAQRYWCKIWGRTLIVVLNHHTLHDYKLFVDNNISDFLQALLELKNSAEKFPFLTCEINLNELKEKSVVVPINIADRPRHSLFPMVSVSEAVECILKNTQISNTVWKSFKGCLSFVLAENVVSAEPYPPFRASIKDGYAVLAADSSTIRDVIGAVTPGCKLDLELKEGSCIRVSTGSSIPDKADAVIQVEDTEIAEKDIQGNELKIRILKPAKQYQDIRAVGSDVSVGEILIPSKRKISAAEIGVLAICGIQEVLVHQKPVVALLSTGDEVSDPLMPLKPGCIRDSNKSSLMSLLIESRIPFIDVGIARDTADSIKSHLVQALEIADIVITTGSVSMGEKDLLKQVLEQDFQSTIHFGRVHMKPGKPTTFSTLKFNSHEKLVFSLPGNPVSAYVCFYLFVIPSIRKFMGFDDPRHMTIKVELAHDIKLDERPEFLSVSLKPGENCTFVAHSTGGQQSSRLLSMQNADALLVLPSKTIEQAMFVAGSKVDAILLKPL